jgi:sugar phosphate permease
MLMEVETVKQFASYAFLAIIVLTAGVAALMLRYQSAPNALRLMTAVAVLLLTAVVACPALVSPVDDSELLPAIARLSCVVGLLSVLNLLIGSRRATPKSRLLAPMHSPFDAPTRIVTPAPTLADYLKPVLVSNR